MSLGTEDLSSDALVREESRRRCDRMGSERVPLTKPHVVLLTMPAPGHVFPCVALGKYLARQGIKVTFLSSGVVSDKLLRDVEVETEELDMTLRSVVDDPVPEPEHPTKLIPWLQKLSAEEMVENAAEIITNLSPKPCCLVCDVFIGWAAMLEQKLSLPRHFLITMSAAALSFMFSVPHFAKQGLLPMDVSSSSAELLVPGVGAIPNTDVWEYFHKGSVFQLDPMIHVLQNLAESFATATYLVNSCEELEPGTFEALREPIPLIGEVAKVVSIGPLETTFTVKNDESNSLELRDIEKKKKLASEVEQWLDDQPPDSVTYIAFGTIFSLQAEQIRELAYALEASQQRFLWILRPPDTPQVIVSKQSFTHELAALLPPGFQERTASRGKICSNWAQQPKILAHKAVGLFMSHCGWNSILEAISTCTPILACPCFVDQWLNARFIEEVFQIGLEVRSSKGDYERARLETLIRSMMEGDEGRAARKNVAHLNQVLSNASAPSTGSSSKHLQQYVEEIFALDKQRNPSSSSC